MPPADNAAPSSAPAPATATPSPTIAPATSGSFLAEAKAPTEGDAPLVVEQASPAAKLYAEPEAAKPEGDADPAEKKPEEGDAAEKKPDAEAKPEGEKPEGEAEALKAEDYEVKLPEGFTVEPETLTQFQTFAAEAKLSKEQAQSLVDTHIALSTKAAEAWVAQQQKSWSDTLDGWKNDINADPVIGGDKSALAQAMVGVALDEFGSPEARAAFDLTGAGWNPAIIKFIYNLANAVVEGNPAPAIGASVAQGAKTIGQSLYGDSQT